MGLQKTMIVYAEPSYPHVHLPSAISGAYFMKCLTVMLDWYHCRNVPASPQSSEQETGDCEREARCEVRDGSAGALSA